jgi:hypothetical protein
MFPVASTLQKDYPDWHTTGLAVTLQDFESQCSFTLAHNSFNYARDMKREKSKGADDARIHSILEQVVPLLEKKSYERVGLRCWFLYSVEMNFDKLVSLVAEKFFVQNEEIRKGICPTPVDVAYTVNFVDNDLPVHLRAGPLKRDQIELNFQPDRNSNMSVSMRATPPETLYSDFPDVSLLIDIDVSKKDVKAAELPNFYVGAQEIQSKLSTNMVRYTFGIKD